MQHVSQKSQDVNIVSNRTAAADVAEQTALLSFAQLWLTIITDPKSRPPPVTYRAEPTLNFYAFRTDYRHSGHAIFFISHEKLR